MLIEDFELERKCSGNTLWPTVYLHINLNPRRNRQQASRLAEYFTKHGYGIAIRFEKEHLISVVLRPSSYKNNSGNLCSNP